MSARKPVRRWLPLAGLGLMTLGLSIACPRDPLARNCQRDDDCPETAFCDVARRVCIGYQALASRCGDGRADYAVNEQCDDGNLDDGDGCSARCQIEAPAGCGDGLTDYARGEQCDDGMQCDDGRDCQRNSDCRGIGSNLCLQRPGDGCSPTCRLEQPPVCPGGALRFDGDDDLVEIGDAGAFDHLGQLTVEAWIYRTTVRTGFWDEQQIVSHHDHDRSQGYVLLQQNGGLALRIYDGSYHEVAWSQNAIDISADRWHHVAGSYDGALMRTFIDGVLQAENSVPAIRPADYTGPVAIGRAAYLDGFHFEGLIDEVRISDVARYRTSFTVADVPFAPDPYTVALFHLDEGSGQSVSDSSRHGFVGTLGTTAQTTGDDPAWAVPPCIADRLTVRDAGMPDAGNRDAAGTDAAIPDSSGPDAIVLPDAGSCTKGALFFDGVDDYVDIPTSADFDNLTALTIECWIYLTPYNLTSGSYERIVSHHDYATIVGWALTVYNGSVSFRMADGVTAYYASATISLTADNWHHVAGAYDGATLRLFVDGQIASETAQSGIVSAPMSGPLRIGAGAADATGCLQGIIDEVRLSRIARYTSAFSRPTDVLTSDSETIGYWRLTVGGGQDAPDETGAHNGTLGPTSSSEGNDPSWINTTCIQNR